MHWPSWRLKGFREAPFEYVNINLASCPPEVPPTFGAVFSCHAETASSTTYDSDAMLCRCRWKCLVFRLSNLKRFRAVNRTYCMIHATLFRLLRVQYQICVEMNSPAPRGQIDAGYRTHSCSCLFSLVAKQHTYGGTAQLAHFLLGLLVSLFMLFCSGAARRGAVWCGVVWCDAMCDVLNEKGLSRSP